MAISVDWGTSVITIPRADMEIVQSEPIEIRELDLDAFRLTLKDLEDDEAGMPFPDTHSHETTATMGGVTYARKIEILEPYTVTFEDGSYAVNLVGANSNVADRLNLNSVSVRAANSAGLVQIRQIETSSYNGEAVLDATNGSPGTGFPYGKLEKPVDTLADALTIASDRNLPTIRICCTGYTFEASDDISGMLIKGEYHDRTVLNLADGTTITNTHFYDVALTGYMGGQSCVVDKMCSLRSVTDLNANVYYSELSGTIKLALSGSYRHWINCWSNRHTSPPTLDFQETDQSLIMSDYSGNLKIANFTAGKLLLFLNAGDVEITSTCTGGTIELHGTGVLLDNSDGTIVSNYLTNPDNIADRVWDEAELEHSEEGSFGLALQNIRQIESGRWKIVSNQMIFYSDDGVTPLYTFDLKDSAGQPTEASPTERVPA